MGPKEDMQKKKDKKLSLENEEDLSFSNTGFTDHEPIEENRHYYIRVTLLNQSWPLNEDQLSFSETLKEKEKEEMKLVPTPKDNQVSQMKVTKKDRQNRGSVDRGRKGTGANAKSKKLEAGKTTGHNSDHATYEMWKAHGCMRVVCDADRVDDCEIKKDKTRLNEIKAMKQAWEAMEEGRAARAKESRQKYLDSLVKDEGSSFDSEKENENNEEGEEEEKEKNENVFPEAEPTIAVVCPFRKIEMRRDSKFYDMEDLNAAESEKREALMEQEEERREKVYEQMEENKRYRTMKKEQLMDDCQAFQLQTDLYRTRLLKPRNEYRLALLADAKFEQDKRDAAAALEPAAAAQPAESKSPKGKKDKKKKK